MKVLPENIPDELKKLDQWVLWRAEKTPDGEDTKMPYTPDGSRASPSNPATWCTFEEALEALPNFDGINFVITAASNIVGIDIDDARVDGVWDEELLKDINSLCSYTEISPSGNGLRAFVKGQKEGPVCHKGRLEMYDDRKFLSVTGNIFGEETRVNRAAGALVRLYRKWFETEELIEVALTEKSPEMTDAEIIEKCKNAKNRDKFYNLYAAGDLSDVGGDASSADIALCGMLAFYTQDPVQIDRIFRTSKLVREKWIKREDYRNRTINKVLKDLTKVWQPKKGANKESTENRSSAKIPENIQKLILEAKDSGVKGRKACVEWVSDHYLELAALPKGLWMKQPIKGTDFLAYPDIFYLVADAFELDHSEEEGIYQLLHRYNNVYCKEKRRLANIGLQYDLYPEKVKQQALNELFYGDPYQYILDVWQSRHVGDTVIGKTLLVCAASTLVVGANGGLHFKPSGESGKGKTSGVDAFLNLLPPSMIVRGGISDKYIYYAGEEINDGSIIFMDDRDLSDNLKGVVKNSISNFQNPEAHKTVLDGKAVSYTPAKRMTWIFASVDGFDDDQLANRFLMADVDSSHEQDKKVAEQQRKNELNRKLKNNSFETSVCRCIFDLLQLKAYDVVIPYADMITWRHDKNRRNQPKFLDIIRAVCIYKAMQRTAVKDSIIANLEDFQRAIDIYGGTAQQNNTNLTSEENEILDYLISKNLESEDFRKKPSRETAYRAAIDEVAFVLHKKVSRTRQIMNGNPQRNKVGLDGKIENFFSEKEGEKPYRTLYYFVGTHDFSEYENFVDNIDEKLAIEAELKFVEEYQSRKSMPPQPETVIKETILKEALPAFNDFNSFQQAFNTNVESRKSLSTNLNYIEKNPAFNKNKKMHVIENTDVLPKNNSTSQNIGGAFSDENVESSVIKDKEVPTDDGLSFQQPCCNLLKPVENVESSSRCVNDKKPTKKLDKEQNTIESFEEDDSEDYSDVDGVFVTDDWDELDKILDDEGY